MSQTRMSLVTHRYESCVGGDVHLCEPLVNESFYKQEWVMSPESYVAGNADLRVPLVNESCHKRIYVMSQIGMSHVWMVTHTSDESCHT